MRLDLHGHAVPNLCVAMNAFNAWRFEHRPIGVQTHETEFWNWQFLALQAQQPHRGIQWIIYIFADLWNSS
jgi:hypothetical protein